MSVSCWITRTNHPTFGVWYWTKVHFNTTSYGSAWNRLLSSLKICYSSFLVFHCVQTRKKTTILPSFQNVYKVFLTFFLLSLHLFTRFECENSPQKTDMERNNRRSLLCICNRKKYLHKNTITAYLLDFRLLPCRIWTGMIIKFSLETFRFTKQKISKLISLEMESSFFMISINMEMLQLLSLLCYPHINELNGHATTIPIAGQFH